MPTKPVRKRKPGPAPSGHARDVRLTVRLTADESEAIVEAAERAGVEPSTWIREIAVAAAANDDAVDAEIDATTAAYSGATDSVSDALGYSPKRQNT